MLTDGVKFNRQFELEHMKEGSKSEVFVDEPAKKRKKRRGRSNLTNTKWRKHRKEGEQKKAMLIEGRGAPADLGASIDNQQGGSWRARCKIRPLNLGLDMAEIEQKLSSNHSDAHEDGGADVESMVSFSITK